MCALRASFIFVVFVVGVSTGMSVTVPESGVESMCKGNCGTSELFGDDHAVVKKEGANSTEAEKNVEGDFFDELIGMLSPGKANQETENTIETPARRGRTLENSVEEAEDAEDVDARNSNKFTARTPKRKVWMAALAGIVLKLASLLPLILGKLTLIGVTALLTSKLSLLIVTIIVLKSMFSSDKGHSYPEAGFTSPAHQGYQEYGQGVTGGYQGYQGYPASANHRRWAYYRGVGRELGSWEDAQEENKE